MSAFTRLAIVALTGMSSRIFRRRRSSTSAPAKRPVTTKRAAAAAEAPAAEPVEKSQAPSAPASSPPVDHFRGLSPRASTPLVFSIAAKSLPLICLFGTVMTIALAVGVMRGEELPLLGQIESASQVFAVALLTISLWGVYLLWKVPQWQAAAWARAGNANPRELFQIENESRGTLGQILSGVAVLTGLIFAWQQLGQTSENLRVSQEGQITDRFSRAVNQLGEDDLTIRLGGIYALERIARDSPRDYGPVMEVLTAFARQESPRPPDAAATPIVAAPRAPPDVRAVFKVIGRRTPAQIEQEQEEGIACLDLTGVSAVGANLINANLQNTCWNRSDLRGAQMAGADLRGTSFDQTNLSQQASLERANAHGSSFASANFAGSNLSRADFSDANLQGANISSGAILDATNLSDANLSGANLQDANLAQTNLAGADLLRADFTGAILFGANLATSEHLTSEQIASAGLVDGATILPDGVRASPVP